MMNKQLGSLQPTLPTNIKLYSNMCQEQLRKVFCPNLSPVISPLIYKTFNWLCALDIVLQHAIDKLERRFYKHPRSKMLRQHIRDQIKLLLSDKKFVIKLLPAVRSMDGVPKVRTIPMSLQRVIGNNDFIQFYFYPQTSFILYCQGWQTPCLVN